MKKHRWIVIMIGIMIGIVIVIGSLILDQSFRSYADTHLPEDEEESDPTLSVVYQTATEYDYPPFSVTDAGVPDGFSVELLRAVAETMDLKLEFKIDHWKTIKSELEMGKLDILPLVGQTDEREVYFDFTVPYIVMHGNIFVRKDNHSINSEEDLKGLSIIVMEGDNAMEYAISRQFTDHLILVKTYTEAFELLSSGKYDAVLAQSIVGEKLISDLKIDNVKAVTRISDDGKVKTKLNLEGFEQKFCFAVKEGDKALLGKLNEGLAIVSENGTYDRLYKKWFPFLIDSSLSTAKIIKYSGIIIIPSIILMLLLSLVLIKKEVRRKTIALNQANEALRVRKEIAEASAEAKGQFLANMSHEIRTPMNGILGMIQLLQMTAIDEEQMEYLRISKSSLQQLSHIINDILDYSKMEAGMLKLDQKPFDLDQALNDLIKLHQISIGDKPVQIVLEKSDLVPKLLVGDAFRFNQILSNFIGNAVKFTEKGKILIEVQLADDQVLGEQSDEPSDSIKLLVKIIDTGIGIEKDHLNQLFRDYNQLDPSIAKNYGGTGLGLVISKGLIEKMDGKIWVASVYGEGTCFSFTCTFKREVQNQTELMESE